MKDSDSETKKSIQNALELTCGVCDKRFIFREHEQEMFVRRGYKTPKCCLLCSKAAQERQEREIEKLENEKWQRKKAADKIEFNALLKDWNVVTVDDIHPENDNVLYIIGNGFDLMHGVRSSYYQFRDSLGKDGALRFNLENFLTQEDIWADFEEALAHFNIKAMSNSFMVNNWLDIYEAYDEDASAADFFVAVEGAADPILTVVNELPQRFRMWVEKLEIGTNDRPLRNMFRNGRVLCFNYTEFVETLYGVSKDRVCYIHGCRGKTKHNRKEKLILGHMPGASDSAFDYEDDYPIATKDPYKLSMIDAAQDNVFRTIIESDDELTKNCSNIISSHEKFFAGLDKIEEIIVVGHSFSQVDWDYFSEVSLRHPNIKNVRWYFGCHGLKDLQNLSKLLIKLGLKQSDVFVFRTDDIVVTPLKDESSSLPVKTSPVKKTRCTSPDGKWSVKTAGNLMMIVNQEKHLTDYEVVLSSFISYAFFVLSGEYMFVVIRGVDAGVFLFCNTDNHWRFVDELKSIPNQSLINPRLRCVFLTSQEVCFVYNNRVREYSLIDGRLLSNQARRNAASFSYQGEDISHLFFRRKWR